MKVYKKKQLYCLYECQNICYPTQIIEKELYSKNGKVISAGNCNTSKKHNYRKS
jgi:hypothetical protein